jgi:4-amino-4-deoxychorismate lyase
MALIDGETASGLPLDDRGLAYGDGVFETVRVHHGQCVWWREHLQRLRQSAIRLGIEAPADVHWDDDVERLLGHPAAAQASIIKLILTRGGGGRGYRPDRAARARRIALRLPPPDGAAINSAGIVLRWCRTRLARQPALAGIKHLNRLEQVLARAEWDDPAVFEGLMLDTDGKVICATAANLFAVVAGRLLTPALDSCGVAGVCRAWLLAQVAVEQCALSPEAVLAADEVFVCSSVRGILPVVALGDQRWPIGPVTRSLMKQLADAHPVFAGRAA